MSPLSRLAIAIAMCATSILTPVLEALACDAPLDTKRIDRLTGVPGSLDASPGVFKVSYPRSDLSVKSTGVSLTPPLTLSLHS